jgi:hypothetical protein
LVSISVWVIFFVVVETSTTIPEIELKPATTDSFISGKLLKLFRYLLAIGIPAIDPTIPARPNSIRITAKNFNIIDFPVLYLPFFK